MRAERASFPDPNAGRQSRPFSTSARTTQADAAMSERPVPKAHLPGQRGVGRFRADDGARQALHGPTVGLRRRLAAADIAGSRAHARIWPQGRDRPGRPPAIERGLEPIAPTSKPPVRVVRRPRGRALQHRSAGWTALSGDAGQALHTAPPRATTRSPPTCACAARRNRPPRRPVVALRRALLTLPSSTPQRSCRVSRHLQVAQPVTFGHT